MTVAPLKPIADALLEGIDKSQVLTQPGQDAHSMALSPSQARALNDAEIIITPDRDMHPALSTLLDRREREGTLIISLTALEGASALPYDVSQPWLGKNAPGDDSSDMLDPHLWLDPLRVAALAPELAHAIAVRAPTQEALLMANTKQFADHLRRDVHPALRAMLRTPNDAPKFATREFVPFLTDHSAYQYFLARFHIANPGSLVTRPEEYLGARSMRDALARAEKIQVGCVISENGGGWPRKIALLSNSKVVMLNPEQLPDPESIPPVSWIQNDYDRLLYTVAKTFAACR